MEIIDIINNTIKIFLINLITYYISLKLINYKEENNKNLFIITITSILNAILYMFLRQYTNGAISTLCIYLIQRNNAF